MTASKCFAFAIFLIICCSAEDQIVKIPGGYIRGKQENFYYRYEGIPYASAPVGKLRYELPQPFRGKWTGIRNATTVSNICIQWDQFYGTEDHLHGDEDCLYLNVYTPARSVRLNETYEVIVYIHGGAFMFGSGSDNRPDRLLKNKRVILVTLNYRLGPLGFLCLEDNYLSCNLGLHDQNMALRWVRDNIHAFNGDPEKVIITGYSAGGASVHLHMLSPKSRGLFKAAVSHSGTALCSWAEVKNSAVRAKKLANFLGCPTENTILLKKCLKSKDAKDIVRAVKIFHRFMYNPFTVFGPTVEKYGNRDAFIPDKLENIIKQGRSAKVRWVVSFTEDDGGYNAATLLQKDENGNEYINSLGKIWPYVGSEMLFFNDTTAPNLHAGVSQWLKKRYLGDKEFSVATYRETQKLFTDELFVKGIERSVKLHMQYSGAPVYVYRFNKTFTGGIARLMSHNANVDFGSIHGDDVYHIFVTVYVDESKFDEQDDDISRNFADLYSSLLRTKPPSYGRLRLQTASGHNGRIRFLQINDAHDYKIMELDRFYL